MLFSKPSLATVHLWMCHSRSMNNKIKRLHERCLRITSNDKTSSFADLLAKNGSVSIHTRNLQVRLSYIRTCQQSYCRDIFV